MRRWLIILLLIVYPFQVALALADNCCVTTPAGVTHHAEAEQAGGTLAAPAFVADDPLSALADPHCSACSFGHHLYLPSMPVDLAIGYQRAPRMARDIPFPASPPAVRLERPKWPASAR